MEKLSTSELSDKIKEQKSRNKRVIAYLPIGCIEQHGPFLPIETDTIIASYLAERLAGKMEEQCWGYVFPCVQYSPTKSNINYCGTISINEDVFRNYVKEICISLITNSPFDSIVIVCSHGSAIPSINEIVFGIMHNQYQGQTSVKPIILMDIMDITNDLRKEFKQTPGRHADWREFLLLYEILGKDYFSNDLIEEMIEFSETNDFSTTSLPVIGIPMERRSVKGVIGEPLPIGEEWLELSNKIWELTVKLFSDKLTWSLEEFFRKYQK